jgi:hypothetical protein
MTVVTLLSGKLTAAVTPHRHQRQIVLKHRDAVLRGVSTAPHGDSQLSVFRQRRSFIQPESQKEGTDSRIAG